MDQYCVVISGLQAGVTDSAIAWAPVAAAFKMDEASFAQRVLAALPLIVRQKLDKVAADQVVQQLQAGHVDARALPDDERLAHIKRDDTVRGPLPLSGLGEFLKHGEQYRLVGGAAEWQSWIEPLPVFELPLQQSAHAPIEPARAMPLPAMKPVASASTVQSKNRQDEKKVAISRPFQVLGFIIFLCFCFAIYGAFFADKNEKENNKLGGENHIVSLGQNKLGATVNSIGDVNNFLFRGRIWTYTKPGNLWRRYMYSQDGHFTEQDAMPTQDSWGEVSDAGDVQPTTGKFLDTGERWFGFDLISVNPDSAFYKQRVGHFIIKSDGTLVEIDGVGNQTNVFRSGDVNPFSR